ncbi:MAG: NAD(P)-dependent oxidoreductase [Alphaproteobacteria bacterium]|nr:NAD(P)-dependent oxidoreductase [Alphaproteobacteria bacterium]MBV8408949.1 NAD(P)-dependent oxidoreductase [Alphaproteobacteria bacterium]
MAERMLKFVSTPQAMPEKRPPAERRRDFEEIYARYAREKAAEQAGRCSQCGVPFCQIHCPLHNNIPDWLKLTAEGRLEEAYELSAATNTFPEICGRICPQDRLCEGNCVIEKGFQAVTIGSVEKFITDTAWDQGWVQPIRPRRERPESVGIVGAGPAGLAAAEQLRRKGYQVTVYDRYDRVGGLLIYGIPNFKLEKEVVQRREQLLRQSKVGFVLNCEVGRDVPLGELRARHDAILIANGVYKARDIAAPGVALPGIVPALDYLTASNRHGLGDAVEAFESGELDAKGKHVVVLGGGDTAMDCVRTAVRQGAKSVKCLYRRDRANMPGSQREVKHAEEEGVEFVWLSAPQAFLGKTKVSHVRSVRIHLGMPDATGRQTPQEIPNSHKNIEADLVLKALGFDPEDLPSLMAAPDLAVTGWRTIKIDWRSMMTSLDGVFAAGDIVRGASLVVWAIRDGRDAAERIHGWLTAKAAEAACLAAD